MEKVHAGPTGRCPRKTNRFLYTEKREHSGGREGSGTTKGKISTRFGGLHKVIMPKDIRGNSDQSECSVAEGTMTVLGAVGA